MATLSRLLAVFISAQLVLGDTLTAVSLPPSARPVFAPATSPVLPPAVLPSSDASSLRSLLSGTGSVTAGAGDPAAPLLIHVQDIHGHPRAQKSIQAAVERLLGNRPAAVLLEGLAGDLDADLFRRSPDPETRDAAVAALLDHGRLSGAAAAVLTGRGPAPLVRGLEDESHYRANVASLSSALETGERLGWQRYRLGNEIAALKKKHFNAGLYLTDLAVTRYESGRMPLASLLTFLRHRGVALEAPMEALLRAGTLELLYDAADLGSELRGLVSRLRGRLSQDDAAALFDVAYRFQKGALEIDDFVATLDALCRSHGIALAEYPNLRAHVERALIAGSVSPDQLYAAVERLRPAALDPLTATEAERSLRDLDRRSFLLGKLASLRLSSMEWTELARRVPAPAESDLRRAWSRLNAVEAALEPAKNFYRLAERRNADIEANILSAARDAAGRTAVVVAGGYHARAVEAAARKAGYRYVGFTPVTGDLRGWDVAAPLHELAGRAATFDGALEARSQTIAPPAASIGALARVAAAHVAKGTLTGRAETVQWGRSLFGYLNVTVRNVEVDRRKGETRVRVDISRNGFDGTLEVRLGRAELAFVAIQGLWGRTLGALWSWLKRFYYGRWGVRMIGVGLHTGNPVRIRIVPRESGHGINLIRTDQRASIFGRTIPATLGFVGRNRRRFTGIESRGLRVSMVEHALFALRTHNIWNADIFVEGEEMPIMDGSAQMYIDALRPLASWSTPPEDLRITEPVVFRRDDNTAVLLLPLEENETDSEFIFVGNYGKLQKTPVEFRHRFNQDDMAASQAELGSHPTFLEQPVADLRRQGLFRGGVAYRPDQRRDPERGAQKPTPSFLDVSNPADWLNGAIDLEGLARHKTMDLIGDMMLLEVSLNRRLKARVIALGTGHRDTAEAMFMLESGYRFTVGHGRLVDGNLAKLLDANKISPELHGYIVDKLAPFKNYDETLAAETGPTGGGVGAAELARLKGTVHWTGERPADPIVERINQYLFGSGGATLVQIAGQVATQQFLPEQIRGIELKVTENFAHEIVCEVAFVRQGMSPHDWPRVAIVAAKDADDEDVAQVYYNMKSAAADNESRRELPMTGGMAADRSVDYFPRVGPYKYGVFARQYMARNFARYAASFTPESASRADQNLPFRLLWDDGRRGQEGAVPEPAVRKAVARATGEMLTAAFLRLRVTRPTRGEASVPIAGQLLNDINLTSDLLFDPVDGKAALGFIRGSRSVLVEQFLDYAVRLTLGQEVSRQSKFPPAPGRVLRNEWQPFAGDVADMLDGVQAELEKTFGVEQGRAAMATWTRRYLDHITLPTAETIDPREPTKDRTIRYRQVRLPVPGGTEAEPVARSADRTDEAELIRVDGVEIAPILRAKLEQLQQGEVAGAAQWVARLVSKIFLIPQALALRWAPVTEAAVFAAVGLGVNGAVKMGISSEWATVAAASGVVAAFALWMASHAVALVVGPAGARWVKFGDLSPASKAKIIFLGVAVAGLPPLAMAFSGYGLAAIVVAGATGIHALIQPRLAGVSAEGAVLDRRSKNQRGLDSQV